MAAPPIARRSANGAPVNARQSVASMVCAIAVSQTGCRPHCTTSFTEEPSTTPNQSLNINLRLWWIYMRTLGDSQVEQRLRSATSRSHAVAGTRERARAAASRLRPSRVIWAPRPVGGWCSSHHQTPRRCEMVHRIRETHFELQGLPPHVSPVKTAAGPRAPSVLRSQHEPDPSINASSFADSRRAQTLDHGHLGTPRPTISILEQDSHRHPPRARPLRECQSRGELTPSSWRVTSQSINPRCMKCSLGAINALGYPSHRKIVGEGPLVIGKKLREGSGEVRRLKCRRSALRSRAVQVKAGSHATRHQLCDGLQGRVLACRHDGPVKQASCISAVDDRVEVVDRHGVVDAQQPECRSHHDLGPVSEVCVMEANDLI